MSNLIADRIESFGGSVLAAMVYESSDSKTGTVQVTVPDDLSGNHVLVLSSYSPVNWQIKNHDKANIYGVYVYSYEGASSVRGDTKRLQPYFSRGVYLDREAGANQIAREIGVTKDDIAAIVSSYGTNSLRF